MVLDNDKKEFSRLMKEIELILSRYQQHLWSLSSGKTPEGLAVNPKFFKKSYDNAKNAIKLLDTIKSLVNEK